MKRTIRPHGFFLCLLLGCTGLLSVTSTAATEKIPVVQVRPVTLSESSESLIYPARVEPKVSAAILAEIEGVVREVVPLGTFVKKGQVLFKIQQLDPVYQYSAAKIVAPVSGVVSEVDVNLGTQVTRGQKIAVVVDPSQLRVSVEIPGSDLAKINKNAKIEFLPSQEEKAEAVFIEGVSPLISSVTGTATANLAFANKKNHLSAGSLGKVIVTIAGVSSIKIPEQALVYRGADPYVRVVEDNKAKYRQVVLGTRLAGQVEIKKGLSVKDLLIERASQFVQDNKAVQVEKQ